MASLEKRFSSETMMHQTKGPIRGASFADRPRWPLRVLVLSDYYLPSCNAGGPVQSLANLIARLGDCIHFRMITRDRDLGSPGPFPNLPRNCWINVQNAQVLYASPGRLNPFSLWKWIRNTPHDILYLNSYFSLWFTIVPLCLRWLGLLPKSRVILAPRGELALSALRQKAWKKSPTRRLFRLLRLYRGIRWQATSLREAADIRRELGPRADIFLAPVLHSPAASRDETGRLFIRSKKKQPGSLRVLFLSRIHPIKNLRFAIHCLHGLRGNIEFTIHGPVQDHEYWNECVQELERLPKNIRWCYAGPVAREDLERVYRRHHVLLLPTQGENFGHVILEALLAGCSVIVSDQTPWRDLQCRGSGWALSLNDVQGFRAALQEMVDAGHAQFRSTSSAALAQADAYCRDDRSVQLSLDLFQQVTSRHPRRASKAA